MKKKEFGEYYLGLDIGTNSVGWAVTDTDYQLTRFHGKDMWGVRMFEEGKPAADRRVARTARRRLMRRKQRLQLARELFNDAILANDLNFFLRLDESKYILDDKKIKEKHVLFADSNMTDKEYFKKYPTIYHLRSALIHEDKKFDVRMIYLAVQHILKHRGHFLFEGNSFNADDSIEQSLRNMELEWADLLDVNMHVSSVEDMKDLLKDNKANLTQKKKRINGLYQPSNDKEGVNQKKLLELIVGSTVSLSAVFGDDSLSDEEIPKISFRDSTMDEKHDLLEQELGEDRMHLLDLMKTVYDWGVLAQILNEKKYLSDAMVDMYDKHKEDLCLLRRVVRKYAKDKYKEVFHDTSSKVNNYCSYIGTDYNNGRKKSIDNKRCKREAFYKYIKSIIKINDDPDVIRLYNDIEKATFMPLERSGNNSVIPYQLHKTELEKILENAEKYYEFLKKTDEKGWSVSKKILSLLTFRIPYYVGPLNDAHKEDANCWIVKKKQEAIRPWNFDDIVDREASAEKFIDRMTNSCTYVEGADVIPRRSILYSEFTVLNVINKLRIDGEAISVELKQELFNNVFCMNKKITLKRLSSYLVQNGYARKESELSGIDTKTDFNVSMQSYCEMREILGDKVDKYTDEVDNIIKWIVIFAESRDILKSKITKEYGKIFTKQEIAEMSKLKYSGWGSISKELLTEIYSPNKDGEAVNIITALRTTNDNLMELLGGKYEFAKALKERNQSDVDTDITYQKVRDMYVSPVVKRQIWQTLTIVNELRSIMGHDPKKVFIEVAKKPDEIKKRTVSRQKKLLELYASIKSEERDWVAEINKREEHEFRRDRLYLYYTQMGKCMYTGKRIENVEDIFDENKYDIDHIFPQSRVKDDSLDNRVLVCRQTNLDKGDQYPISNEIKNKMKSYWTMLLAKNLITRKKYDRLVRAEKFSDSELADFIARQLVETRQSTKAVAQVLDETMPQSRIVYAKANIASDFRQKFDLPKVRAINDLHHAKDAYINIITGNVYDTRFTNSPANRISKKSDEDKSWYTYNLQRIYDFDVKRGDTVAWVKKDNRTISTVKRVMGTNRIQVTRLSFEKKGQLFDLNVLKKGKGQLSIKSNDERLSNINKYGGYNSVRVAYFCLIEHTKKEKRVRSLVDVPIHLKANIEAAPENLMNYLVTQRELIEPEIIISKIKIQSTLNVDGLWVCLKSKSNDRVQLTHMQQLIINSDSEAYLKKVDKVVNILAKNAKKSDEKKRKITPFDGISEEMNITIYELLLDKICATKLNTRYAKIAGDLSKGKDCFILKSLEEQVIIINEVLQLLKCDEVLGDLTAIGGAKNAGSIMISAEISNYKKVELIDMSPTGLFIKRRDLLK